MKTYVLSLKERTDRRERFSLPWDYEYLIQDRVTGVVGVDWCIASIGCILAHRQAIEIAYDKGLGEVLVLEDDAELVGEMPAEMPKPITFLGGIRHELEGRKPLIVGTHAMYYNCVMFETMLSMLPTLKELQASEHPPMLELYDMWLCRHIDDYGYKDVFISNDEEGSDIPHGPKVQASS